MTVAGPIEVAGYLDAAVGVGEAARRYVTALRSAGAQVLARDLPLPGRDSAGGAVERGPDGAQPRIGLLCVNPEQLDQVPAAAPVRIGVWSWEVDIVPDGWAAAAEAMSDVWTYSRFGAELIERAIGRPVFAVPPPVVPTDSRTFDGSLPDGFRVLVMFDYLSTLERKNPLGAIAAYRAAFQPGDGTVLVVKSMNGRHRPDRREQVARACAGRPDITICDRTLSAGQRDALVAACDCFLSLHRSEGHGMPLAEAMAAGKPVVATAYGGNTEFMHEGNSWPVRWTSARVGPGVEHYPAGAAWAEPDIGHAAESLRAVRRDPAETARRVRRGRVEIESELAPAAIGARMLTRIAELEAPRPRMLVRARARLRAVRRP